MTSVIIMNSHCFPMMWTGLCITWSVNCRTYNPFVNNRSSPDILFFPNSLGRDVNIYLSQIWQGLAEQMKDFVPVQFSYLVSLSGLFTVINKLDETARSHLHHGQLTGSDITEDSDSLWAAVLLKASTIVRGFTAYVTPQEQGLYEHVRKIQLKPREPGDPSMILTQWSAPHPVLLIKVITAALLQDGHGGVQCWGNRYTVAIIHVCTTKRISNFINLM